MNAACRCTVSTRFAAFPAHTPCNTRHVHRRSTLGSSLLLLPATACCPPPLLRERAFVLQKRASATTSASVQPGAAGVSQPWFRKRACSSNTAMVARRRPVGGLCTNTVAIALPYHGGLTPAALVTGCAFVHRKNRFFAGRRAHCETRAGGVSPPWFRKCAYKRVSSTLRTTFARPQPCRADVWHSTDARPCGVAEQCSLFAAPRSFTQPRRADARRS
jgi:hypothetical protein